MNARDLDQIHRLDGIYTRHVRRVSAAGPTPPRGEHVPYPLGEYVPPEPVTPDPEPSGRTADVLRRLSAPYGHAPGGGASHWQNDPQYGYPPPGAPNTQFGTRESGHEANRILDPTKDPGLGKDPAFGGSYGDVPYSHYESHFPGYAKGTHRRMGDHYPHTVVYLGVTSAGARKIQVRRLRRGRHGQVIPTRVVIRPNDQLAAKAIAASGPMSTVDFGEEGVLP